MMYVRQTVVEQCRLAANEVTKEFREVLLGKLRARMEGRCSKHGYVKSGSIEIAKVAPGILRMISLNGDVIYTVQFRAEICNPTIGSILRCRVKNTNKFGVLAVSMGDADTDGIVEVIVSKQGTFSSDIDLNALKIGDVVNVELLGKKFEINDRKITGIGRIVTHEQRQEGGSDNGGADAEIDAASEDVEGEDEPYTDEEEGGDDTDDDGEEVEDGDADADVDADVEEEEEEGGDIDMLSIPDSGPLDDVDDVPDEDDPASEYDI